MASAPPNAAGGSLRTSVLIGVACLQESLDLVQALIAANGPPDALLAGVIGVPALFWARQRRRCS